MKTIWSVMLGLALTLPIHAGIVVLVDEDFSDLAVGGVDGGTWFTTDSGFELYDSGGFAPRGMSSLYGENAGGKTTSDAVPGGNEVLANSTDVELGFTVHRNPAGRPGRRVRWHPDILGGPTYWR